MDLLITRRRSIAGLFLDATIEERYQSKVEITQNPVEFGASINDHRIRIPDKYIVSGRVSDTPISGSISSDLRGGNDQWAAGNEETRSKSAWSILKEIKDESEPFTIESGLQRYDNMMIVSLTAQQSAKNANALDFTAECTQVIIVSTQDVAVDFPEPGPTEEQASEEVDRGDVQTKTPTEEKEKSILFQITEAFESEN